jgi:hypothetical protein
MRGRTRLRRDLMRLLRPFKSQGPIRWLNRDLAIGRPEDDDAWQSLRAQGVVAVVDLSAACGSIGERVRQRDMRYLRLPIDRTGLPEPEELHIVTSWVLERISSDGGSVLIHDTDGLGNDALLACAVMVKNGWSVDRAKSQLRRLCDTSLVGYQVNLLHQFVAQRTLAENRG